jgi:cellulose synthase/poly-beta-1,6-N-acetylglucosamine synthase-like glycosyltransferase
VLFVVEEKSVETVTAVEALLDDPRFELLRVPDSSPRTKPKAINYALPFVRGAHVVVYDAEDVPDADQLRKAASVFAADRSLDCLQAELVVDNASETALAGLFAGEYAGQFGLMLPLLARWGLPMPLGGTSNHFLTRSLRRVGGWDAYNVTEDADLGVRLARLRYRTATLDSRTHEEAPLTFKAWMAQRTRWTKGWMQTLVVHNRRAFDTLGDLGWKGFLAFEIYVGSMIVSALLHTVFVLSLLISLFVTGLAFPDTVWGWANAAILVVGYGGALAIVLAGLVRVRARRKVYLYQLALPIYWVLHTIAAARAAYELFARPHYWAKTEHGRTKVVRTIGRPPVHGDAAPSFHQRVEPVFSEMPGE